jgi:hypothetical protein
LLGGDEDLVIAGVPNGLEMADLEAIERPQHGGSITTARRRRANFKKLNRGQHHGS